MPRFHLPMAVDFSTRDMTTSTTLAKAHYIQNGYIREDKGATAKLYNRTGIKQTSILSSVHIYDAISRLAVDTTGFLHGVYAAGFTGTDVNIYTIPDITSTSGITTSSLFASIPVAPTTLNIEALTTFDDNNVNLFVSAPYTSKPSAPTTTFAWYAQDVGSGSYSTTARGASNTPIKMCYPGIAYLDTYVFLLGISSAYSDIGDDANVIICNSNVGDPVNWNSSGYIIPELRGGTGVGIDSYKGHVAFFGTHNIQFFYDAAQPAPGSPLLPRNDLVYNFGLVSYTASPLLGNKSWWKSKSGDVLAFIGQTHNGHRFIGMFNEFVAEHISNEFIDDFLDDTDDVSICGYTEKGKTFIHICINNELSLYYDTSTKLWHVWESTVPSLVTNSRFIASSYDEYTSTPILINQTGLLYYFDEESWVDNASSTNYPIDLVVQLPRYRGETGYESQRKFQHELQIIGDTLTSADTVTVQYSDDDYQTFSTGRTIDMTQSLKQLNRLGYFRERAFKITYSGTQQIRLEALEGQVNIGKN